MTRVRGGATTYSSNTTPSCNRHLISHLDHGEAHRPQAEDRDARPVLHLARVPDGAPAGRDAAAEQAHLLERRTLIDLCE